MYALAIHGGAGALPRDTPSAERDELLKQGLSAALAIGQRILESGGNALDAVEAAVVVLEDDPQFNAGRGAVLTGDGTVELDAAIMDGATLRAGAVAQLRHVRNPIRLARHILESLPHVFLVGDGAERYAVEVGLAPVPEGHFITAERREQLAALEQQLRQLNRASDAPTPQPAPATRFDCGLGTVGAVARDRYGHVAAATSTGGMVGKRSGRVGDSPVIGAGTYADDRTCAVSATGHGEWLLRTVQAYDIAARMRYGAATLQEAVEEAVGERLTRLGARAGLIAVNHSGEIVMRHNTESLLRASVREQEAPYVAIY